MRLVVRIGSCLLIAAAIAIALTVPAPAFKHGHDQYEPSGRAIGLLRVPHVSTSTSMPASSRSDKGTATPFAASGETRQGASTAPVSAGPVAT